MTGLINQKKNVKKLNLGIFNLLLTVSTKKAENKTHGAAPPVAAENDASKETKTRFLIPLKGLTKEYILV